jgi:hypothetical protein
MKSEMTYLLASLKMARYARTEPRDTRTRMFGMTALDSTKAVASNGKTSDKASSDKRRSWLSGEEISLGAKES